MRAVGAEVAFDRTGSSFIFDFAISEHHDKTACIQ
jgi:hypothetical protein